MTVVHTIEELDAALALDRDRGRSIGFVPTMGALHRGHRTLLECSARECERTVASIFVNPTQFNQSEDFEKYPRTLEADLSLCREANVDVVFAPSASEMYPGASFTTVEVSELGNYLCGAHRPGHFRGVATVVAKLLHIVRPDKAYFGEKDAQQLAIIQRMVADLNFRLEIVPVPTVREDDGLAMSSRNARLAPEHRAAAPAIYRALQDVREALAGGEREPQAAKRGALARLREDAPLGEVEYLEIVDLVTLRPLNRVEGPALIAAAVWMGGVRLIDNIRLP